MNLQQIMENIHKDIDNYFLENRQYPVINEKEMNIVLDIEACPTENKNEVLTYSIALMSCDNDEYKCYKYNNVSDFMNMLLNLQCEKINIYVHNLMYDFKPFMNCFINEYNATQVFDEVIETELKNPITDKKEKLNIVKVDWNEKHKPFEYKVCLKKGQLYNASFYGYRVKSVDKKRNVKYVPIEINWFDTFKIVPYSLQKCCSAFLDLDLPKDGLDYEKVRHEDDKLSKEEKVYIYNDVYGLSNLVKKLIIKGFEIDGKKVQYTKLTNSSQSMYDYKLTLLEDYKLKQNMFSNEDFYHEIDTKLYQTKFFKSEEDKKSDILFKTVYPSPNYFIDRFVRQSYFGGLSTVHFDNVKKYQQRKNKIGKVYDVNSLYPYIMKSRLLPYGVGIYNKFPYKALDQVKKDLYPLYIQEITIQEMRIKPNKMAFVQVKNDTGFNGREVISENINIYGDRQEITLTLCNPLLDLLFENYDVVSYKLGGHIAFRGQYQLFENYLNFWGEIKKRSKGANREIAKLRQNALYGKFGTSGDNEMTEIKCMDNTFKIINTHKTVTSDSIYVAMSSFITSYAKQYLVHAINDNYENFLYCDTDSLHLFGENVKGIEIDSKKYGAWDNEMIFNDFRYIGSKRYAEKDINTNQWTIKCCGLSDSVMKQVTDIETFDNCEYDSKTLNKIKLYTSSEDVYYYKDKECTQRVKGLYKSKKSRIVKGGTLIIEQPYQLNGRKYY